MPASGMTTPSTAPLTERIIAAVIDIVIVAGLCFFPRIGWILGLIYHLGKESMPFMNGQSCGKHLLKIKVVNIPQLTPITGQHEKSVIRGLVMLIPVLNLIDLWWFVSRGYRLADKWAETTVVYSTKENQAD
ncbi:RDD family protein [Xiashengella succiniciproducens]|jgi:uncharacterized RDD family membrane protein YckC|uniref:RDD domain-containing protein n=1 Tax=Xiashengella succiniciproducens TaxID=2949635 RepID=A0A9J6ZSP7_9BACT|nr:RDD family protein [Alkaliflexus sp. Ai-910]URW80248.1 hypothetical protein M9189_02590 [Alkaliflexus sp. Ai-910]HHT99740.1 RDD family protein [Bacteroidales bacterium]